MNTKTTKTIVAVLLVMVLSLGVIMPQGSWASEKEEETYTLPAIKAVKNEFPAKSGYELVDDMWLDELHPKDGDMEWVDDPEILAKAKKIKPKKRYNHNRQLDYLSEWIVKDAGEKIFVFDDFASKGMERVFTPGYYQSLMTPSPGDIAWEGNRPWSQGFVVDSFDPNNNKVVIYGWDYYGDYVAYRASADRFYYFRVRKSPHNVSSLTRDNYPLMLRESKRPLMTGSKGYFRPDEKITRAEFAQILVNLFELEPKVTNTKTSFSDVKPTDWFAPAVEAAKKAGLIKGTPEGKFLPQQHVTYEQVAVVLANYWKRAGLYQKRNDPAIYLIDRPKMFLPAELQNSKFREEVEFAVRLGVFGDYGAVDISYYKKPVLTRKEMAEILARVSGRHSYDFSNKKLPVFNDCSHLDEWLYHNIKLVATDNTD